MAQRKKGKKPAAANDGNRKGGRSGASPRRSASSASVAPPKRLRIIGTLLVALAFVGALYWLASTEAPNSDADDASNNAGNPTAAKTSAGNAALKKDTEYTFHSRLEDFEIEVDTGGTARSDSAKNVYLIQAGSFKTHAQAERRLVELKLLSLDPAVEEHINSDGSRWQRVLLGPYNSRSRMSGVRNVLLSNDIDAMVMQRRAP